MDKRTIWVILGFLLIMVGVQYVGYKIYPPVPAKKKNLATTVSAGGTNVLSSPLNTNEVEAVKAKETLSAVRPPEQIVAISNEFIRVEFTSWGGGIRSVELIKHRGHGMDNTVLNGPYAVPALTLLDLPGATSNDTFAVEQKNATTVVLHNSFVTKTVTLGKDYVMQGDFQFPQATAASMSNLIVNVGTAAPTTPKEAANYLNADWQDGPKWSNRDLNKITKRVAAGQNQEPLHNAHWVAVKSQYFALILSSTTNTLGIQYAPVHLPHWADAKDKPAPLGVTAAAELPLTRAANGNASCSFTYYTGPKEYDRLYALGQNQEEAMDFGSWMDGYSGIFGLVLMWSLNFFYSLIHNYGVAIILVTVTLKILFWPIQAKSIKSMKAMQKFQPQIQKLKDKCKDDPQRMNQETMKLYREHKINPFSGCLPMLVQLPVLLGFYRLLVCDIALRGAPFLWIKDLAQPDTVAMIGGIAINPLPVVMTISSIMQQRLTPTTGDPQQAKMMMFMPLLMLVFFYNLASGLTLYYTLQQLLSVLQQWLALRNEKKSTPTMAVVKN